VVIHGSMGTPDRHLGVQMSMFVGFRANRGLSWNPLGAPVWRFCVILCAQMEDSFQVHVFDAPRREMMPQCGVCMCYKHSKNCGFAQISLFPLFHEFGVPGGGFRSHFGVFW